MKITAWGPMRCGSNWYARMLHDMAEVSLDTHTSYHAGLSTHEHVAHGCGWKHGEPTDPDDADVHLVHVKHPVAYLTSMQRFRGWSLLDKLSLTIDRIHSDRVVVTKHYGGWLDAYIKGVRRWLDLLDDHEGRIVRYEDVIADPVQHVARTCRMFGLEVYNDEITTERVDANSQPTGRQYDMARYGKDMDRGAWFHRGVYETLERFDQLDVVHELGYEVAPS